MMGEEDQKNEIRELKSSSEKIGQLYPILLDYHGNIIDGEHRYRANKNWMKIKLEHIKTDRDRLIARIIGNICRRNVSRQEKRKLLNELGEIYLKEGLEFGKISHKIAEDTGMSYTWVMKYLPYKFKNSLQSKKARAATHNVINAATWRVAEALVTPPDKDILSIRKYGNVSFVNILLEGSFYSRWERISKKMNTTPTILISNVLLLKLKELEKRCS